MYNTQGNRDFTEINVNRNFYQYTNWFDQFPAMKATQRETQGSDVHQLMKTNELGLYEFHCAMILFTQGDGREIGKY